MAKAKPVVTDRPTIPRTVWVPVKGYNFLVERTLRRGWGNVKDDLSQMLDRAIREEMEREQAAPPPA